MGIYSQEELDKIRQNIQVGLGNSLIKSRKWKPDWTLHERLGLDIPDLMTKEELDTLLAERRSTPPQDPKRVAELWTPYINAEVSRVSARVTPTTKKKFLILGGASATGKSTFRDYLFERQESPFGYYGHGNRLFQHLQGEILNNAVEVDPDNAKLIIPEYQAHLEHLTPGGASFVHEESRNIAEALRQMAVSMGLPVVYDTSGQFNNTANMFDELSTLDYDVEAVYFMSDLKKLLERVKIREIQNGRGVQESIVRNIHNNLLSIIPSLWKDQTINKLSIFDTTNISETPNLILRIERDEFLRVDLRHEDEDILDLYFTNKFWK